MQIGLPIFTHQLNFELFIKPYDDGKLRDAKNRNSGMRIGGGKVIRVSSSGYQPRAALEVDVTTYV